MPGAPRSVVSGRPRQENIMTLFATLTVALSAGGGRCLYKGRPKWGTRIVSISPGGGREGWAGQTWDMSVTTANLRAAGAMAVVSLEMGPGRWLRSREIQCLGCRPAGLRYLPGPAAGGQGCSASSCSSCLKRFLEARLGRSHRRQPGRHWSSTLCRGQGGRRGAAVAQSHPQSPLPPQRGAGPTSSMKAPTKLKATRPSSSSLK